MFAWRSFGVQPLNISSFPAEEYELCIRGRGESFFYGKLEPQGRATGRAGCLPEQSHSHHFVAERSWERCQALNTHCVLNPPHHGSGDVIIPILQLYAVRCRNLQCLASVSGSGSWDPSVSTLWALRQLLTQVSGGWAQAQGSKPAFLKTHKQVPSQCFHFSVNWDQNS